ncbi:hypothetical protein [Burkholderia gladioli]|uniref:hypothetical protein n=1 Tax=Burkholderia gladioli TaxID=28095 RepID=UPI0012FBD709|nr:hypothetical protein [Burkholderia gladioli]
MTASLGTPYRVEQSAGFAPVIQHKQLEGHKEVDVVITDLSIDNMDPRPNGAPHRPQGELDLWAKCDMGFIDARVRTVLQEFSAFERILDNGGIFIVFAAPRIPLTFVMGCLTPYGFNRERQMDSDVWGITSELRDMGVNEDTGEEIQVVSASPVGTVLAKYLDMARFECTLVGGYRERDKWQPLAVNKYGHVVGLMRQRGKGLTIVLPQIAQKAEFLRELMATALPDLSPHIFPEIEHGRWVNQTEYELPHITELHSEKARIISEANAACMRLENEIKMEREKNGWLHDLLTGTGDHLVNATKKALNEIGFERVIDVDEIRDQEGKSRREDLRIEDRSPLLIIDIKGIGGYPSDDDATQANKHAFINTKELSRTDLQGLAIINHQRHLPPLDRENKMPFRQELLDVAGETSLGLMTAFDLYRLIVNMRKHSWPADQVKAVFYRHQRIDAVPTHYRYIGTVAKAMTGKFGVVISENCIAVGDRIAVEGAIYFDETDVESIQINGNATERAQKGDPAGFLWPESNIKIREGMRVFAVPRSI